jgi:hypothetical protein
MGFWKNFVTAIKSIFSIPPEKRFAPKGKGVFLSHKIKARAERKFRKRLRIFKKTHKRNPTKNELFMTVVNASHITDRRHGHKGHWKRQKIRKYLLEKHKIVKKYKMR